MLHWVLTLLGMAENNYLESLTIEGYKSIAKQTIEFGRINMLIGANGSGKSNLLSVLKFIQVLGDNKLESYVRSEGGADEILHFGIKNTKVLKIKAKVIGLEWDITLLPTVNDTFSVTGMLNNYKGTKDEKGIIESKELKNVIDILDSANGEFRYLITYHLNDTSPEASTKMTCNTGDFDYLRENGANLAAFLLYSEKWHPASFKRILYTIQLALPFIGDLKVSPTDREGNYTQLRWEHKDKNKTYYASALSDGALRFIFMATLLLQPTPPPILIIDEPELGLHPSAIGVLASMIKVASEKSQILIATQSPQLLDYFEPEDILVAERENEATIYKRLNKEDLSTWLADYSLSELWDMNIFGGRP